MNQEKQRACEHDLAAATAQLDYGQQQIGDQRVERGVDQRGRGRDIERCCEVDPGDKRRVKRPWIKLISRPPFSERDLIGDIEVQNAIAVECIVDEKRPYRE